MAEIRLHPHGGWVDAVRRVARSIMLGSMAEGYVAAGLPRHLPASYEAGLSSSGPVLTVATAVGQVAAETLVYNVPPPDVTRIYV